MKPCFGSVYFVVETINLSALVDNLILSNILVMSKIQLFRPPLPMSFLFDNPYTP